MQWHICAAEGKSDWVTGAAGGITAGVPGLADILEQDWSEEDISQAAHSEPTPPSLTPRSAAALRPARSAPPLMTPLTEETEGDLRSTSHAQRQSRTFGQLGTGYLSTAGQGEHPKPWCPFTCILEICCLAALPQGRVMLAMQGTHRDAAETPQTDLTDAPLETSAKEGEFRSCPQAAFGSCLGYFGLQT